MRRCAARQRVAVSVACGTPAETVRLFPNTASMIESNAMPRPLALPRNRLQSACTAVLAAAFACALVPAAHAQTTDNRPTSAYEGAVDADTRPGDDFFLYANGGWLKATEI